MCPRRMRKEFPISPECRTTQLDWNGFSPRQCYGMLRAVRIIALQFRRRRIPSVTWESMGVGPMSSVRGTIAYREEYVLVHFGIVEHTGAVSTVWQRRDGVLSGVECSHKPRPGRTLGAELWAVFGLTEIRTLPVQTLSVRGRVVRLELEAIARQRQVLPDAGKATADNIYR
jgi:hypothetical protein